MGSVKLISIVLAVISGIYRHFIRCPHNLLLRYGKDGEAWALVTGASDGNGAEYCKELARLGFNICLVSRTLSKLKAVESEVCKINPKVKTRII